MRNNPRDIQCAFTGVARDIRCADTGLSVPPLYIPVHPDGGPVVGTRDCGKGEYGNNPRTATNRNSLRQEKEKGGQDGCAPKVPCLDARRLRRT